MEPIVRPYNPNPSAPPLVTYVDDGSGQLVPVYGGAPEAMPVPQGPGVAAPTPPGVNPQMPMQGTPIPQAVANPVPMAAGQPPIPGPVPPAPGMDQQAGMQQSLGASMPQDMPGMNAGPPKTPEEAQSRKTGWMQFIDGVKDNPQQMAMLLHLGTNLMQPTQPGQTHLGHFGMAVQDSQNYLQSLRAAELKAKETEADIGLKKAQTVTEGGKPAVQAATVDQIGSETGKNRAQTDTINQERAPMILKLKGEVDKMLTDGQLDKAKARLLSAQADAEPEKAAEEIELMKAHAWYFKHPGAAAAAHESARVQSIDNLAKAYVGGGDPELTAEYKKDPATALNKAKVKAAAGQVGSYWTGQAEQQQADEIYGMYSSMYDRLNAGSSKQTKGLSKEEFIINQMMTANIPPTVTSKVMARMGPSQKPGTPAATTPSGRPGSRPSLQSFDNK